MSSDLPEIGATFESRYRIDELLGEGGFARVFVATDTELGRKVALKVLRPQEDGYDDTNAARFLREAKLVARLNHPNIVTMFDYGTTDTGLLFAVFELVGGQDLSRLMDGAMPEKVVVRILEQVLHALGAAHKDGLLHRDVKPANIRVFEYMGDPYCVKLLDFGIARPTKDDAGLTASGMVVGTPRFMAPEQLYEEPDGPHSDIYSVGLLAYEMLVGERSNHLQRLIHQRPVRLPDELGVSPAMRRVIDRMLERHVPPRYASAVAARQDLLAAGNAETTVAPPAKSPPPHKPERHRPPPSTVAEPPPEGVESAQDSTPILVAAVIAAVLTLTAAGLLIAIGRFDASVEPHGADAAVGHNRAPGAVDDLRITPITRDTGRRATSPDVSEIADLGDGPSSGCGVDPGFVGTRALRHTSGLSVLEWRTHVPTGYDPDEPHPLVVLLHDDSYSNAEYVFKSTSLAATADKHDFLIAAPRDDDVAYPWTEDGDLQDVERVLAHTREQFCIDDSRIFVIGYGGGGWGAEALSCRHWVAGVAVASFLLETPQFRCEPARAVPTLSILPMDSGFLPPGGGPDCIGNAKLSFDKFEQMWRDRNECTGAARTFAKHEGGQCQQQSCETPYVSCRVNGGRRWAGAPLRQVDLLGCDGPANTFPYNETIWRFFNSIE